MAPFSIEDNTEICFNVYCYNVQPGITINYDTGDSSGLLKEQVSQPPTFTVPSQSQTVESVKVL